MSKLYEYRTDSWSQHLPDTAIITIGKHVIHLSSYKGGITTYWNYIHVKLGFINLQFGFPTKKLTKEKTPW